MKDHAFLARKSKKSSYTRAKEALHTSGIPHEPKDKRTCSHVFKGGKPVERRQVTKPEGKTKLNPKPRSGKRTYLEVVELKSRHCVKCGLREAS